MGGRGRGWRKKEERIGGGKEKEKHRRLERRGAVSTGRRRVEGKKRRGTKRAGFTWVFRWAVGRNATGREGGMICCYQRERVCVCVCVRARRERCDFLALRKEFHFIFSKVFKTPSSILQMWTHCLTRNKPPLSLFNPFEEIDFNPLFGLAAPLSVIREFNLLTPYCYFL